MALSPLTDDKVLWNHRLILAALEETYNDGTIPGAANAIDIYDLGAPTNGGGSVDLKPVRPYYGASKQVTTNKHRTTTFWTPGTGAGAAGGLPGFDALLQMSALAAATTTGMATVQNSPPTPAAGPAPAGAWTYVKATAYAGTVDRIVTITCTTAGDSGVAEVTVSSPATLTAEAYEETDVLVTTGQPLALPGGAVITPTVTTPFAAGDVWTILLLAPGVDYTPVTNGIKSAALYYHLDSMLFRMTGARSKLSATFEAGQVPKLSFDVVGLWNALTDPPDLTPDYSAFQEPTTVGYDNTPWFSLHGQELVMRSLTVEDTVAATHRERVNQKMVTKSDRPFTGKAIFDLPQRATWDAVSAAEDNAIGELTFIHGRGAGQIIGVSAPRVQLANPVLAEDQEKGTTELTVDLAFLPSSGNDELVLFIR